MGLLKAFVNIPAENLIRNELSDLFRGALAENYVAQALRAGGHQLYYWTSETPAAELDFVLQKEGKIIPVEVKKYPRKKFKTLSKSLSAGDGATVVRKEFRIGGRRVCGASLCGILYIERSVNPYLALPLCGSGPDSR